MNDSDLKVDTKLKGTKFQILKMLLSELDEEFWRQCRELSPEDHTKYFETKYESFKQLCPTLYRKSYTGGFQGDEKNKIMELANQIERGILSKADADDRFAWWMTNRLQASGKLPPKGSAPSSGVPKKPSVSAQTKRSNSWLFS